MIAPQSNGHLNTLIRDHDSAVTGFGKHDRVVCFLPEENEIYMRIDHKWSLGMPTVPEMLEVARKDQYIRGRWKLARMEKWTSSSGEHTDVYFIPQVSR